MDGTDQAQSRRTRDGIESAETTARSISGRPDAELFARLARELAAQPHVDALLQRVVDASATQIDGAEHAGITVLTRKSVSTPVATDELVRQIDGHQYSLWQGPCLTAAVEQRPVVSVPHLLEDERWPQFAAAIADLPVRSMLSFQLYTNEDTIGALNIYASAPDAFSEESVQTGLLLATHAAVAVTAARRQDNLRTALSTRDTIGQAKGILMERHKITADQAFDLLIVASQHTQRKLNDVAESLVASGELATE